MTWPYRGDSPLVQARRVALAYRQQLDQVDPQRCAKLDKIMTGWGQGWAIPRPITADPDAWLGPADAADLATVSTTDLRRLRAEGRLSGRRGPDGWKYQVREIMALSAEPRTRQRKHPPESDKE